MGEDPLALLTLAALGGASGRSPLSPSRDHRSRDRRYSDRRYSIASPASENRLIVVIAASTRPDHLLSSSPMRSTGGNDPVHPPHVRCSWQRVRALSFESNAPK